MSGFKWLSNLLFGSNDSKLLVSQQEYDDIRKDTIEELTNKGDSNPEEGADEYMELNFEIEE